MNPGHETTRSPAAAAVTVAVAILGLGIATGVARVKLTQTLSATDVAPAARGRARLVLRSVSDGRLDLVARRLHGHATFDVIVRGVKVASLRTSASGRGRVRFRSRPRGRDVLLGFDPRGAHVAVRDEDGDDVLVGDILGDPLDPGEVVCCLPEDDESADPQFPCDGRAPAACEDSGGTVVAGARSCLPNPCGDDTIPDGTTVCCIPESSGGAFVDPDAGDGVVDCQDVSERDCLAVGGTVINGETCDDDPCEPVAPAAATKRRAAR
jgi:hypothetical protein